MCDIGVSIICNAYNHEKYIKDALEGFVMQRTTFPIEVLVHDDASTDNTANIIREYEKKYPDIIKPIYQTENQYSKDNGAVGKIQRSRARGKYIASCEGDDYWTDPYKLQKQFDAMEKHPQYTMCAHAASIVEANTKKFIKTVSPMPEDGILSIDDVILQGGGYVVTSSLFYRENLRNADMLFKKVINLDYTLQILGAVTGNGILYLSDNMSVYRWCSDNSWSVRMGKETKKMNDLTAKVNKMLEQLNKDTDFKYETVIKERILKNRLYMLIQTRDINEIKKGECRNLYFGKTLKERAKINLKCRCPFMIEIYRKIKRCIGNIKKK